MSEPTSPPVSESRLGRKAGLTTASVIAAAADLADEIGLHNLTLAVLADRLGVRSPSLYRHVNGLPELQFQIALRGVLDLADALADAPDLATIAHAYRRYAVAHPGRYAASLRADPRLDEAAGRALAPMFALLATYGVPDSDRVHAARIVRSMLHGFVSLELAGGFGLPDSLDETYGRLVAAVEAGLRR
ncbi:WHG domain-containing protein [Longispora sp. NPDC051575]|uniref:TetR/AcrR family transcriptional regulator n=1 Tax=Longispora sp. NPDC051575 TaxID=3154943 RepID=UPI0034497E75